MRPFFQFTPFVLLYVVAALSTGAVMVYALSQRRSGEHNRTILSFTMIMGSASLWSLARTLQTIVVSPDATLLFSVLVWVGWGGTTVSLLCFSLAYTGRGDLLTRRTVTMLLLPVGIGVLLSATNHLHHLFGVYTYEYQPAHGLWLYSADVATGFFVYAIYPHGAAAYGVYRLVRSAVGSATLYGKQAVAVAVGAAVPLLIGTLFLLGMTSFLPSYIDPTPLGFAITGLCLGYAIFEYGLLELVPIARRTAWDELEDAVVTLDGQHRVLDANTVARELFGVEGEYVGMPANEFFEQVPEETLEKYAAQREVETQITLRLGGEPRHFSLSMSPIEGDPNGQSGRVIVLRDITSLKRRQEELELLRQVQSRVLRHNIRNEMTTIRGNAELLAERNGYDDRLVDVVRASEDLLSISQKARLAEEIVDSDARTIECDLREIVEEGVDDVTEQYPEATITIEGPESCPVEAAPRLEIAIENLLENAVEHNDAAAPQVLVSLGTGDTPRVTITDNGPGIPEAEIAVLEDEQETALEHGSGLGLWLVKWIVDRSDAHLSFETNEEGTAVTLQFCADAEQPDGEPTPVSKPVSQETL